MVMQSMRKGAETGFTKYILLGLLGMAVGGLAIVGIGDSYSGGAGSSNDVLKVAGKSLDIRQFDYAFRRIISRYNMTPQQAHALGVTQEVLGTEVRSIQLQAMSERMGIAVPKEYVAQNVAEIVAPYREGDQTLQQTLQQLLQGQGLSEKDFISALEKEIAGNFIVDALNDGISKEQSAYAQELYVFRNQTRDVELLVFEDKEIKDYVAPTDLQLTNLYEALKHQKYSIPEYRSVNVAYFNPEAIEFEVSISEEEIRSSYDDNLDSFAVGKQYVMTQVIVADKVQADEIYTKIMNGHSLEDAKEEVIGTSGRLLKEVPFEIENMLPVIADMVDEFEIGKTTEPISTPLGYHIIRVDGILPVSTKSYEAVKRSIEQELKEVRKSDYLYEITVQIDELLQGGATVDEVIKDVNIDMTRAGIPLLDRTGVNPDGNPVLERYNALDHDAMIETIFEINGQNASSLLQELPSGILMAYTLEDIVEKSFKPFDEVKGSIEKQFIADQQRSLNRERVKKLNAEIGTGASSFDAVKKEENKRPIKVSSVGIQGELKAPLTEEVRAKIFRTAPDSVDVVFLQGKSALIRVTGYYIPEIDESAQQEIDEIAIQLEEEFKQEIISMYLQGLNEKYPAKINQALLDRVYRQQDDAQ